MHTLCKDFIVSQETGKHNATRAFGVEWPTGTCNGNLPTHFVNQHLLGVMPTVRSLNCS